MVSKVLVWARAAGGMIRRSSTLNEFECLLPDIEQSDSNGSESVNSDFHGVFKSRSMRRRRSYTLNGDLSWAKLKSVERCVEKLNRVYQKVMFD